MLDSVPLPAKPGTACLGCRRRKLRCSREAAGCTNCTRSDLPCVYPAPETGVKKKRGPYKKDKPAREKHLEDLVKYLEPKNAAPRAEHDAHQHGQSAAANTIAASGAEKTNQSAISPNAAISNSEDLVKDALNALTKSCAFEKQSQISGEACVPNVHARQDHNMGSILGNPSPALIFKYWQLFVTRVDPVTKLLHCPSFGIRLLEIVDDLANAPPSMEALIFSICYIAVSTCTAPETKQRFGESREALLHLYGRKVEAALSDNYSMPVLESLQALVLYIISIRRRDDGTNVRALFALAVRMAQMMGVNHDPGDKYTPFEAELRRRLWWHICGLESRGAEEGGSKAQTIMAGPNVQIPANLNDFDIGPSLTERAQSRPGITQMTFFLIRIQTQNLMHGVWSVKKNSSNRENAEAVKNEQMTLFNDCRSRLESQYLQDMDSSRPYDWLCATFAHGMLIKARLKIDFPDGLVPTKFMPAEQRKRLLRDSVHIIRGTNGFAQDERLADWSWFFRGYMQWHSLAIVVAELGWSTNQAFTESAWAVLDPILATWDSTYKSKRDEPAWDHVNGLISRARQSRAQQKSRAPLTPSKPIDSSTMLPYYTSPSQNTTISPNERIPQMMDSTFANDLAGGAPTAMDFDIDFSSLEGFDEIDFQAFDEVFSSGGWDAWEGLVDGEMKFT